MTYLLRMARVRFIYLPTQYIREPEDNQKCLSAEIKLGVRPGKTIGFECLLGKKDEAIEKKIAEHGVPDRIEFSRFLKPIEEHEVPDIWGNLEANNGSDN